MNITYLLFFDQYHKYNNIVKLQSGLSFMKSIIYLDDFLIPF